MSDLLYIFGDPGIGKSTLVRALVQGWEYDLMKEPFANIRYANGVYELGSDRTGFRGTDALELDVQPKVVKWLDTLRPELLLAEGDRLANSRFFGHALAAGYKLWPVYLTGKDLAAQRRLERSQQAGIKPQDPKWVAGRVTKSARLADEWDALTIHPAMDAAILKALLPGPVAAAFNR